jgi:sigma-B regulation protein RsbU (phosphoserine phosphatase)
VPDVRAAAGLEKTEVHLRPGDVLVLYTDGLVESRRDGELFGPGRLMQAISRLRAAPAEELAAELAAQAREFAGGVVSDDIAVVVLRVPKP